MSKKNKFQYRFHISDKNMWNVKQHLASVGASTEDYINSYLIIQPDKYHNRPDLLEVIFKKTVSVYREAVDFMIQVCLQKWEDIRKEDYLCSPVIYVERLCHRTKRNPEVSYESFDRKYSQI